MIASVPTASVAIGTTATDLVSVTVNAPRAGTVALVASGTMGENGNAETVKCGITDQSATTPPPEAEVWWTNGDGGNDVGNHSNLSVTRVFDIAANTSVNDNLVCYNPDSTSSLGAPQLTATYVPDP